MALSYKLHDFWQVRRRRQFCLCNGNVEQKWWQFDDCSSTRGNLYWLFMDKYAASSWCWWTYLGRSQGDCSSYQPKLFAPATTANVTCNSNTYVFFFWHEKYIYLVNQTPDLSSPWNLTPNALLRHSLLICPPLRAPVYWSPRFYGFFATRIEFQELQLWMLILYPCHHLYALFFSSLCCKLIVFMHKFMLIQN